MIKSYNLETSELSFHKKLLINYTKILSSIHKDFKNIKPILSGSAAINLVVAPSVEHSDYDFYFNSEEHFNLARQFLFENKFKYKTETKNCIVFENKKNKKDIQLIKTFYGGVTNVLNNHDFINCSIAFENNILYVKKQAFEYWRDKKLHLQNLQCNPKNYLNPTFSDLEISTVLGFIVNLIQRIEKYTNRYDLIFSEESIKKLKPFRDYIIKLNVNKKHKDKKIYFTNNVYYSTTTKSVSYEIYINKFLKILNLQDLKFSISNSCHDLYYYFDFT